MNVLYVKPGDVSGAYAVWPWPQVPCVGDHVVDFDATTSLTVEQVVVRVVWNVNHSQVWVGLQPYLPGSGVV